MGMQSSGIYSGAGGQAVASELANLYPRSLDIPTLLAKYGPDFITAIASSKKAHAESLTQAAAAQKYLAEQQNKEAETAALQSHEQSRNVAQDLLARATQPDPNVIGPVQPTLASALLGSAKDVDAGVIGQAQDENRIGAFANVVQQRFNANPLGKELTKNDPEYALRISRAFAGDGSKLDNVDSLLSSQTGQDFVMKHAPTLEAFQHGMDIIRNNVHSEAALKASGMTREQALHVQVNQLFDELAKNDQTGTDFLKYQIGKAGDLTKGITGLNAMAQDIDEKLRANEKSDVGIAKDKALAEYYRQNGNLAGLKAPQIEATTENTKANTQKTVAETSQVGQPSAAETARLTESQFQQRSNDLFKRMSAAQKAYQEHNKYAITREEDPNWQTENKQLKEEWDNAKTTFNQHIDSHQYQDPGKEIIAPSAPKQSTSSRKKLGPSGKPKQATSGSGVSMSKIMSHLDRLGQITSGLQAGLNK